MVIPALIYIYLNTDDSIAIKGWAIPAATDIAFALGALSLLGSRVPTTIKSGVHATLAGVTLAMFIPMKSKTKINYSPLKEMENDLHPLLAFIILPMFAFKDLPV